MTDEQIIKALECCGNQMFSCTDKQCKAKVMGDALDLINCQKAEIADSKDEITELKKTNTHLSNEYIALSKECDKLKAEIDKLKEELADARYLNTVAADDAIKEFAERLKERVAFEAQDHYMIVTRTKIDGWIDDIVEEMTEER